MKSVVIAGSASLETQALKWKGYWEQKGFQVLDYPRPIPPESFLREYPRVFLEFFDRIAQADLFFVMNEGKNGVPAYLGPETFAELAYAVYLRMKNPHRPQIILLQPPQTEARGAEEIHLWAKLELIRYLERH